jgi:hypothetical protein
MGHGHAHDVGSFILTMTSTVNSGMTIKRTGTRMGACTP